MLYVPFEASSGNTPRSFFEKGLHYGNVYVITNGTFSLEETYTKIAEGARPEMVHRDILSLDLRKRIKENWPEILEKARDLERQYPDPIQGIIGLLGSISGDYESWREVIEEPYG